MTVYDNPVGVMTNGPKFDWHLTNLDNYTFLSNVDRSSASFGSYKAAQPDSGIATAGLGVFMLLAALDQPVGTCAAASGVGGHMATRLLFTIERAVEARFDNLAKKGK